MASRRERRRGGKAPPVHPICRHEVSAPFARRRRLFALAMRSSCSPSIHEVDEIAKRRVEALRVLTIAEMPSLIEDVEFRLALMGRDRVEQVECPLDGDGRIVAAEYDLRRTLQAALAEPVQGLSLLFGEFRKENARAELFVDDLLDALAVLRQLQHFVDLVDPIVGDGRRAEAIALINPARALTGEWRIRAFGKRDFVGADARRQRAA